MSDVCGCLGDARCCELRRIHHGRTSGSVKLHSLVSTLSQQGTEVQGGRSSILGCMSLLALIHERRGKRVLRSSAAWRLSDSDLLLPGSPFREMTLHPALR